MYQKLDVLIGRSQSNDKEIDINLKAVSGQVLIPSAARVLDLSFSHSSISGYLLRAQSLAKQKEY